MITERPHHVLLAVENLDTATLRGHVDTLQLKRATEGGPQGRPTIELPADGIDCLERGAVGGLLLPLVERCRPRLE
eukprot:1234361-Pyramimonas_sp.AAC.1